MANAKSCSRAIFMERLLRRPRLELAMSAPGAASAATDMSSSPSGDATIRPDKPGTQVRKLLTDALGAAGSIHGPSWNREPAGRDGRLSRGRTWRERCGSPLTDADARA